MTGMLDVGADISLVGAFLYVIGANVILRSSLKVLRLKERGIPSMDKKVVNVNIDDENQSEEEEGSGDFHSANESSFESARSKNVSSRSNYSSRRSNSRYNQM